MILPPEAPPPSWSSHHQRLHRHLLARPALLPRDSALLLAVSGGQDSIALAALLADLRRLHGWELILWHGDHGWRPESAQQAQALELWAGRRQLAIRSERADPLPATEAAARSWRYGRLGEVARSRGCVRVVTGHTASDRAETVLLNLARGSHRRGLASLPSLRPLHALTGSEQPPSPLLARPLLPFSRADTARVVADLQLPVLEDPSNHDRRFRRNRLRAEVLPVLEAIHPGAVRRIAALAERLEREEAEERQLLLLALAGLRMESAEQGRGRLLSRAGLAALGPASRCRLLGLWLEDHGVAGLTALQLETLARRLDRQRGPGSLDLAGGWRLAWDRSTLSLNDPAVGRRGDDRFPDFCGPE